MKPIKPQIQSSQISQILSLCKSGSFLSALHLFKSTIVSSKIPSKITPLIYSSLLQTATKSHLFTHCLQLHSQIIKLGISHNSLVGNTLLSLYFKSNLSHACKVFDELPERDIISWTAMISGHVRINPQKSIDVFREMVFEGVGVNGYALSAGIKACSEIGDVKLGKCFHGCVLRGGFEENDVIGSALIDMYGRNGWVGHAYKVFDELPEPDTVCWASLISVLTKNDMYHDALTLFYVMQRKIKLVPDEFTFGSVLTACGNLGRLKQGKQIHGKVIVSGLCGNVVAESSLVDMYAKCERAGESQKVFDRMRRRNAVSWCALLNGYCQNKDYESVIRVFRTMEGHDVYCFGTVIRACGGLAAVKQGKEVHCQYIRKSVSGHVIVESALVDLYAKCGCVDYAERVFSHMPVRNLISWNSMICGFAQNGRGLEAIELFNQMVENGIKPDNISFLGVIFACSHAGLVDQGQQYFISMTEDYNIKPGTEHCNCMVDMLGRAGLIEEAENLIENAGCKDAFSLWPALLGACLTSRNSAALERIALKMMKVDPGNHLSYVHLINVYKSDGRWNDATRVRKLMEDRGVEKPPGRSWVENGLEVAIV